VPSTVDAFRMPARRPDLARPWAERGQRPHEPPPCRSPRAGSRHHGDAAQRRRAHLAVDARAGEGAHCGAVHRLSPPLSIARVEKTEAPGERNALGLTRAIDGACCSAEKRARPFIFDRRSRSTRASRASFSPGGTTLSWPRPRLPSAQQ
jgi:hypothetical protein